MAAPSPIRLLLVNASPEILSSVEKHLDGIGVKHRLFDAATRQEFLNQIRRHQPHLVLADEEGVPGLPLNTVLEAALKEGHGIPVIVLGRRPGDHPLFPMLHRGVSEYFNLEHTEGLPAMIDRLLFHRTPETGPVRLENAANNIAGLMRENQRLVTIGRLTGSIAHEINNPLESVTNLLFLIEQEPDLPLRVREYLGMAQRELERVVEISKQTLNFYRDTASPAPTQLSSLLNEVLVLYMRRISDKQLEVIRRFGSEEPLTVFPGEIRQVFSNLIANAIEASTARGKLYLRIRKSRFWGDPKILGVRITIADEGMGMSPEVSRRVGEAFFTTKGEGGTGLGLWVTRSIIRRYGGNLFLRSSTGKRHGTVFSILLPTNLRPQAVAGSTEAKPEVSDESVNRTGRLVNGA